MTKSLTKVARTWAGLLSAVACWICEFLAAPVGAVSLEFILRSSKKYLLSNEKSHFRRPNFPFHVLVPPFFVVNCTAVWLVSGYPKFEKYIIYVTSLYLPRTAAMEDRSSLFTAWTFNSTQLAKSHFLQRLEIRKWVENVCLCLGPYVDCLHTIPHLKVCAVSLHINNKLS